MDVTVFRKNDQLAKKLILLTCRSSRLSLNDVNGKEVCVTQRWSIKFGWLFNVKHQNNNLILANQSVFPKYGHIYMLPFHQLA